MSPSVSVTARTSRMVRLAGSERELLSFAGCDYLALSFDKSVLASTSASLAREGLSAGASRTTSGTHAEHLSLEAELALFLGTEACALLPDGALADLAALSAASKLLGDSVTACAGDADAHPALLDAAAACGLTVELYSGPAPSSPSPLILTDGVFPMAGRQADMGALVQSLAPEQGLLIVDDSHGFGVLGESGRGAAEGVVDSRLVRTGSLSKALGCSGGFVAGTADFIQLVRQSSAYFGTTPIPPFIAAGCRAALRVVSEEPCVRMRRMLAKADELAAISIRLGASPSSLRFPVRAVPSISREAGERFHIRMRECGIFVPFVHYHGSPAEGAFRLAVNADHTSADLDRLEEVWTREARQASH